MKSLNYVSASLTLLLLGVIFLTACQVSEEALAGQAVAPAAINTKRACDRNTQCRQVANTCIQQDRCNSQPRGTPRTQCTNNCYQRAVEQTRVCVQTGPEVCDRIDNDCNSRVDDIPLLSFCNTGLAGSCSRGSVHCVSDAGRPLSTCLPPTAPEVCDGQDNDCDGLVDNGFYVQTDVNNCGSCGNVCPQGQGCQAGQCIIIPADACYDDDPQWRDETENYWPGGNPYVRGTVTYDNGGIQFDECRDGRLSQVACNVDESGAPNGVFRDESRNCPVNTVCADGACVVGS